MGIKFRGVHHVSLCVADIEEAGRFYTETLGMETLPRPDFGFPGLWLAMGPQQLHLIQVEGHETKRTPLAQHFALHVEDLDDTVETLRGQGVEVTDAMEIPAVGRQAFLHDPSGNMVELNQPVA